MNRSLLIVILGLLLSGCVPKIVTTTLPEGRALRVTKVAVYPFKVRFNPDPALSFRRTLDLVNAARDTRQLEVYSYDDFQVFTLDSVDAYQGRSLLLAMSEEGENLEQLAILRGEAALVGSSGRSSLLVEEAGGHRRGETLPVKAWVELYHQAERQVIARAEVTFDLDPLDATSIDPTPELTRRVRELARAVFQQANPHILTHGLFATLPMTCYESQYTLFQVASDEMPSLARRLLSLDEVDQLTQKLLAYQAIYPHITLEQVQKLNENRGLLVVEISEDWLRAAGLEVGDMITEANGQRIYAGHQLDRQLSRTSPGNMLELKLIRNGVDGTLEIRMPDAPALPVEEGEG